VLALRQSGLTALDFFESVSEDYGIDEAGFSSDNSAETVQISRIEFELPEEHYRHLTSIVNPTQNSEHFGIDLYQQTIRYIDFVTV